VPSAALLAGQATLPSQRNAVDEYRALEAAKRAAAISLAVKDLRANTPTPSPSSCATSPVGSESSDTPVPSTSRSAGKKRAYVEDSNEEDDREQVDDICENACTNPNPAGKFVLKTTILLLLNHRTVSEKNAYIGSIKRTQSPWRKWYIGGHRCPAHWQHQLTKCRQARYWPVFRSSVQRYWQEWHKEGAQEV